MGLFDSLLKKESPTFKKVEGKDFTLENQNVFTRNPTMDDLTEYLGMLFQDSDQFVTLTLSSAKNGVRYMQACMDGGDIIIQLGLESGEQTRLVERTVSEPEECTDIFVKFFETGLVDRVNSYKPVKFR